MLEELLRGDRDFQKGLLANRRELEGPDPCDVGKDPCECGVDVCEEIDPL